MATGDSAANPLALSEAVDEETHLVLECGSSAARCGVAGDDTPRCVTASWLARARHGAGGTPPRTEADTLGGWRAANGNDAAPAGASREAWRALAAESILEHPIDRGGFVRDWDGLERLWRAVFPPRGVEGIGALLVSEPLHVPARQRERTAELAFETFGFPQFLSVPAPILSLYSSGRTTGLTCLVGDGLTQVCPVYEGYTSTECVRTQALAGRDVTLALMHALAQTSSGSHGACARPLVSSVDAELVRVLKENAAVTGEGKRAPAADAAGAQGWTLPDGTPVGAAGAGALETCADVLFRRQEEGRAATSVPELIASSIFAADMDTRSDLMNNIIVCGGTARLPGFIKRLTADLRQLLPSAREGIPHVTSPYDEAVFSPWIGGSIVASLSCTQWLSKDDFMEHGPARIHTAYIAGAAGSSLN